mgnify:CR=1 FL=1
MGKTTVKLDKEDTAIIFKNDGNMEYYIADLEEYNEYQLFSLAIVSYVNTLSKPENTKEREEFVNRILEIIEEEDET